MRAVLRRVDPDEHMDRWYLVTVQATLFEPLAVVCAYGSRRTNWQQVRIIPAGNPTLAQEIAQTIVSTKLRRGYELVEASDQ